MEIVDGEHGNRAALRKEKQKERERRIPGNLANWQIWGENVWLESNAMKMTRVWPDR